MQSRALTCHIPNQMEILIKEFTWFRLIKSAKNSTNPYVLVVYAFFFVEKKERKKN